MWRYKYISLLCAALLLGCGDDANSDNPSTGPVPTSLVSATVNTEHSIESLKSFAQLAGQSGITELVKYGVKTYTLLYKTTFKGSTIQASGLLYIPQGIMTSSPLISLQHGTTFEKDEAPSVSKHFTGMEYFASAGYIAIMPDFIGYGESAEIFHPYYDKEHSALAVIDMIKSAKEFLIKEKIPFNEDLFLAGYSEGGYVTLAAAKEMEDPKHNLTVKAVAAGAGGYDLTGMLSSVTGSTHYTYPGYLAFVLMSYNNTYGWNKPLAYFFQDKYAQALATYFNGKNSGGYINSKLTTNVAGLLNPDFYARLKTAEGEQELKSALQENSVAGWRTNVPIRLYHGTMDEVIPYQNSESTFENFKSLGSPNVSLKLIPKGTHGSSFDPMLQDFVPWFETLRK